MDQKETPIPNETNSRENTQILQRILKSVEKRESKPWMEILCVIVLSMATMLSAWCTYQSTLWRSKQTLHLATVTRAGREGAAAELAAQQGRAFDAAMFIEYVKAKHEGNADMEKFLFTRFRPEMKTAVSAWLKKDPLKNTAAPLTPFKMPEYVQPESLEIKRHEDKAAKFRSIAEKANTNANNYVLLTVRFASVLFLSGISGMMRNRRLHYFLLFLALALFVSTLFTLTTMPISGRL